MEIFLSFKHTGKRETAGEKKEERTETTGAVKGRQDNLNNNNHKTSKTINTSKRRRSLVQSVLEEVSQTMCHIRKQINIEHITLSHVFTDQIILVVQ